MKIHEYSCIFRFFDTWYLYTLTEAALLLWPEYLGFKWNTDGLQRTNLLFNLGPLRRTMKLLLIPLPTNCGLHAVSVLELLDLSEDKSHSLQDDLLY